MDHKGENGTVKAKLPLALPNRHLFEGNNGSAAFVVLVSSVVILELAVFVHFI